MLRINFRGRYPLVRGAECGGLRRRDDGDGAVFIRYVAYGHLPLGSAAVGAVGAPGIDIVAGHDSGLR